jgi:hypothetical protein
MRPTEGRHQDIAIVSILFETSPSQNGSVEVLTHLKDASKEGTTPTGVTAAGTDQRWARFFLYCRTPPTTCRIRAANLVAHTTVTAAPHRQRRNLAVHQLPARPRRRAELPPPIQQIAMADHHQHHQAARKVASLATTPC